MQGIATGSLLYVVFFEIIEKERAAHSSHHIQLLVIMMGSATIIALKVLEDVLSGGSDPSDSPDTATQSTDIFSYTRNK